MNTDTLVVVLIFYMSCYFWMITLMKNVNFQIAKVQPQDVA